MNRLIFKYFILGILFSACSNHADYNTPRTFYLDARAGDDLNTGTNAGEPWKSLERINQEKIRAGDKILIKPGMEYQGSIFLDSVTGTPDMPVVITSSDGGRALINGGDTVGIYVTNSMNIIVKNLNIRGSGRLAGNTGNGIEFRNVENGWIDSIDVEGFLWSGVRITGGKNIRITHVNARNNGFSGINVESGKEHIFDSSGTGFKTMTNLYIGYCVADNNPGCPIVKNNHSGNGILVGGVTNGLIEYCEAKNNGWDMPRDGNGPVGIWAYMSDSIIIRFCYAHHNKTSPEGKDGGGFDFDGGITNSIMENNRSEYNEGGGYGLFQYGGAAEWKNNIIRNNTSLNDGSKNGRAGIHVWCDPSAFPMSGCLVENNTIVSNQAHGVRFEPGTYRGFRFINNVFALTVEGDDFINGDYDSAVFENNQYWSFARAENNRLQPAVPEDKKAVIQEPKIILSETR